MIKEVFKKFPPIRRIFIIFLCFLFLPSIVGAVTNTDQLRKELEAQMNELQVKINQYQSGIQESQEKSKTLKSEIKTFEDQINAIKLEIKQIDLAIQDSSLHIDEMEQQINDLETQITQKKSILAEYIGVIREYDNESLLEIMLKKDNFSEFFNEISALENTQESLQDILNNIQELKNDLDQQKSEQETERDQQYQLRSLQVIKKTTAARQQNKKETLLKETKGKEELYQKLTQSAEKNISYIKEQLSLLDKYHMTLEEAVQDAIFAASKVGIRPAFLLGVLEAESRLGLNVGTGNWTKDMYQCYVKLGYPTKAAKEKQALFQICQELNLNPDLQLVSAEPYYGCGGALGVAQFMPATWLAYRDRIASLVGHAPNPWNHKDAFTAAAIKLADGGADQRNEEGERAAYSKYLAGANWSRWIHSTETNTVINLANNFQEQYFK